LQLGSAGRSMKPIASRPACSPPEAGLVHIYVGALMQWYALSLRVPQEPGSFGGVVPDCSLLQDSVLGPVLGVKDPRTCSRLEFIGAGKMTELEAAAGGDGIAFAMYPVTVDGMMAVADAGGVMPPKSTCFRPKPRHGFFVHRLTTATVEAMADAATGITAKEDSGSVSPASVTL
jgi:uncharacterized protein (DUF1015 family)